jgi:hypothetical protein
LLGASDACLGSKLGDAVFQVIAEKSFMKRIRNITVRPRNTKAGSIKLFNSPRTVIRKDGVSET